MDELRDRRYRRQAQVNEMLLKSCLCVGREQEYLAEEGIFLVQGSGHLFLTQRCHMNWVGATFTTHTPLILSTDKDPGILIYDFSATCLVP